MELPHIMLLIDDDKFDVVEPEFEKRGGYEVMYDTDLNMGGGHLKGYKIPEPEKVLDRLQKLLDVDVQTAKYGKATNFLFAVGDGNHSLATAKAHYEDLKKGCLQARRKIILQGTVWWRCRTFTRKVCRLNRYTDCLKARARTFCPSSKKKLKARAV